MMTKKISLNELRILVKQVIKEYDKEKIYRDYPKLPDDRKKNITDFLTKRQIEQGYKFNSADEFNFKYFLTRDGIKNITPIRLRKFDYGTEIFKYIPGIIDIIKKHGGHGDYYLLSSKEIRDRYGVNPEAVINLSQTPYNIKDSIDVVFDIYMRNLMSPSGDNIDFDMKVYGTLNKKNDKYNPPFKLHITKIDIENSGIGFIVPSDNRSINFIVDRINTLVKEQYKFSNSKDIFIDEVIIDRNSFYK